MQATRVPQTTPRTYGTNETGIDYHPLSDLGPPPLSSASNRSYLSSNTIPPTSATCNGPAQLLMQRLYNKPENSDVLLNVRRQEHIRMGHSTMVGISK